MTIPGFRNFITSNFSTRVAIPITNLQGKKKLKHNTYSLAYRKTPRISTSLARALINGI